MVVIPLLVVLIGQMMVVIYASARGPGQFCVIGRQYLQIAAVAAVGSLVRPTIGRLLFYCYFQSVIVCRSLSVSFGAMYEFRPM